jgi:hypothetical protein
MSRTSICVSYPSIVFAAVLALGLSACAGKAPQSNPAASLSQAHDKLRSDLEACTAAHSYDPANSAGVPQNQLAPGELEWRDCAYTAARNYGRANPPMRLDYELLIVEDREMTQAIEAGTMTRSERRAKLEARLADIRAQEERQLQEAEGRTEEDQQRLATTVESIRGFAL